jgi:hypothetical protein
MLFWPTTEAEVLQYIDNTEVGKRLEKEGRSDDDVWDIERLGWEEDEEYVTFWDGGGQEGDEAWQRQESRRSRSPEAMAACWSQDVEQDYGILARREHI